MSRCCAVYEKPQVFPAQPAPAKSRSRAVDQTDRSDRFGLRRVEVAIALRLARPHGALVSPRVEGDFATHAPKGHLADQHAAEYPHGLDGVQLQGPLVVRADVEIAGGVW